MSKKHIYIGLRICVVIAVIILSIIGIIFLGRLTAPFIIAFFIALIINPLVNFLQYKMKIKRAFAVISAILIITALISAAITLLVNEIIQGFYYLSTVVPEHFERFTLFVEQYYAEHILPIYNNLLAIFRDLDSDQRSTVLDSIQIVGTKLTDGFTAMAQGIGNGFYAIILKLPNMFTSLIIALLATFFISKDWHYLTKKLNDHIPEAVHKRINQIHRGLQKALLGFLKAEFKLTFISAVIVLIGLLILQIKHALTIALIIWVVDFIPYIGAIIIFLPWAIYSFATGNIGLGIGLSILYGLIVLQRQLIKPKILSSSIGISPLLTIFTMFVGFKLVGLIGIVLGPLTFIFLKILYEIGVFNDMWNFVMGQNNKRN